MCGISGIFNWNKKEEISRNILDNMLEKISIEVRMEKICM